ncbi:MAG: hypothetical protein MK137_08170, partial [Rickettsiales bacterium]|nr:hypothetical protein [Rickettsiales bacterium]
VSKCLLSQLIKNYRFFASFDSKNQGLTISMIAEGRVPGDSNIMVCDPEGFGRNGGFVDKNTVKNVSCTTALQNAVNRNLVLITSKISLKDAPQELRSLMKQNIDRLMYRSNRTFDNKAGCNWQQSLVQKAENQSEPRGTHL